jgi:NADH-quinone oxidoreductase subunit A
MQFEFAVVLFFFAIGAGFVFFNLLLGKLLRPHRPDPEKLSTYECGERPVGQAWFNFNPRFYIVALIFVIFEVEVAFIYPVAVVFGDWYASGRGLLAFMEIFVFVAILAAGLAYCWVKGDLDWVKKLRHERDEAAAATQRAEEEAHARIASKVGVGGGR